MDTGIGMGVGVGVGVGLGRHGYGTSCGMARYSTVLVLLYIIMI